MWHDIASSQPPPNANPFTAAEYAWKQAFVPVVWSGLEKLQNTGRSQVIDLVTSRISNGRIIPLAVNKGTIVRRRMGCAAHHDAMTTTAVLPRADARRPAATGMARSRNDRTRFSDKSTGNVRS